MVIATNITNIILSLTFVLVFNMQINGIALASVIAEIIGMLIGFKYIKNDKTYLERGPLEKIASLGKLIAFKHYGFWQCMDTKRDKDILHKILKKKF